MRNILITCVFIFFIQCLPGCTGQNQKGLTVEKGVLTVGVESGYPPMEYYDTDGVTLIGFDIDLTKKLAEKLDLQVKYIDTRWEGIFSGLDTNRYDIAVNITILPERQKKYNFTKPYIDSFMTITALKKSQIKIEKPEDIEGFRVSFQGNTTAQYFTERLNKEGVKFTSFSYDKITNCFDDLKLGRVDLIAADNIVAFDYAAKENSPFEVLWSGNADEYIGICLKKGNDTLTNALNAALDELFEDGIMTDISQKYFGAYDIIAK
jgi:polar amino acid transport system substrate-binding protein